ncbi:MAG TPA: helix-turn-helix domain-containing protein [Candidatus Paceibacterota bacterium]
MYQSVLSSLGLSEHEEAIYTALVQIGQSSITEIANKTGKHRPLVYRVLATLLRKGLVNIVPKGRSKRYVAVHPSKLREMLTTLSTRLDRTIPELERAYEIRGARPLVRFLEGKEGIKSVFQDVVDTLKKGEVFYRFSSIKDVATAEGYLPIGYRKAREAKRLERLVIMNEQAAKSKEPSLERFIKTIPEELSSFDHNVTRIIYADKVAYVDYNSETAVIIENPIIATFERKIFELLYKKL